MTMELIAVSPRIWTNTSGDHHGVCLSKHLDISKLRAMASDRVRWVDRVGDTGGGQYQVSHGHYPLMIIFSM